MPSVRLLTWLFILLTLLESCTSPLEDARQELKQLGITYTPEAFLKSVGENKVRAVALFLAVGMDPNMEKSGWLPPLITAVMNCDGHLSKDGNTHTEIIKLLLTHGANVEVTSPYLPELLMGTTKTWTPLFLAVRFDCPDVITALLSHDAIVDAKDDDGSTPLIEAAARGYTAVAQTLLDTGAQVNARTSRRDGGRTALIVAAENGHIDTVHMLLGHGAGVNARNDYGSTALSKAAARGHPQVVQILLRRDAQINATDMSGSTALIKAAYHGHTETVRELLESGADIHVSDTYGQTALARAEGEKHQEIVRLLQAAGAN